MSDETVKMMVFVEDPVNKHELALHDMHKMAKHWSKVNKDYIKIVSGIYNVQEDTTEEFADTEEYRRNMIIRYTGEAKYQNPQTCGHEHKKSTYDPINTCLEEGLEIVTCEDCLLELGRNHLDALGHDMSDWIVRTPATCDDEGLMYKKCSRCDYEITQVIPKIGHHWISNGDGTHNCATEDGCGVINEICSPNGHGDICEKCGYMTPIFVLDITTESLASAIKNREYNQQLESNAEDGTPVWTLTGGSLPSGLSLSANGVISGTPTVDGTFNITVEAAYDNQTDSKTYTLIVTVPTYVVTFDPNFIGDGAWLEYRNVAEGHSVGTLPVRTREGYDFEGWYTADGTKIDMNFDVFEDITVYAKWSLDHYVVTFNAEGGVCSETTREVDKGSLIGPLPEPTYEGYVFGGWFNAASGGLKVDETFTVSSDITLYARWGTSSDIVFGDATTQFNIAYNGDRTNYNNQPYTLYHRVAGGAAGSSNLELHTGISSDNGTNEMSTTNKTVKLYIKAINNGNAGTFDIGFDCDSYIVGNNDDNVHITRIAQGVKLGDPEAFSVTVPVGNEVTSWVGKYNERTSHRWDDVAIGHVAKDMDTGYTLTIHDIYINSGSYTIIEVDFVIP